MTWLQVSVIYLAVISTCDATITLEMLGTLYIPYSYTNGVPNYDVNKLTAEQSSMDETNNLVYTVGKCYLQHYSLPWSQHFYLCFQKHTRCD